MMLEIWLQALLLFSGVFFDAVGAFVGINIGTDLSNLPPPTDIVAILKSRNINHIRLFDADAPMLHALSNTKIEVMVSVRNQEVLGIGESPSRAATWINNNIVPYLPSTNITAIAVGSEVLTSIPHVAPVLVNAIRYLHNALVASSLNHQIKVSTPQPMDIIPRPFPPSTAEFNSTYKPTLLQILQFLKNTRSFYMLNAYPYYEYVKNDGIFPLDYALFKPLSSVQQIVDPNTLFHYDSMFDALVDATYNSIAALSFSGIPIVVTETGWPSFGGSSEPEATAENAEIYNNNLVRRVENDSGPPSQSGIPIDTYIYELFNEDKRPGPVSERNWGVVFANGTAVYDLSLSNSSSRDANSSTGFCVASPDADNDSLKNGINWACGQGQADCKAIQKGQPCFEPNNLQSHASYAYNDYYQRTRSTGGTCDFGGSATLTNVDPSHGSCIFTRSSNSTGVLFPPPASGPVGPASGSSRNFVVGLGTITAPTTAVLLLLSLFV
ncbi:hypothetical protein OROMI_014395 [Orobanche minor]